MNAPVPLIILCKYKYSLIFHDVFFQKKGYVGLPVGKDNMLFTPHYILSYSVH